MATKSQRYEIIIKMHNKAELTWHNVNTGIFKAHRNVKDRYHRFWDYYTIYRKSTKEEIEKVYNRNFLQIRAVKLFLNHRPNSKNTGIIANFIYSRNGYDISRGINFSEKVILDLSNDFFTIPEQIFNKAFLEHQKALFDYYIEKGHQLTQDEIILGDFQIEKVLIQKVLREGTEPSADYP